MKDGTSSIVDIESVSAEELAGHLLLQRFDGDETAAAKFLLEAVSTLPNAELISEQLLAQEAAEEGEANEDEVVVAEVEAEINDASSNALGDSLLSSDSIEISCIQPRSKFDASCHEKGMQFVDKKGESFTVLSPAVQHVIVFPKPEDCRRTITNTNSKKSISDMVLLVLKDDAASSAYKSKALKQVCLQLPVEAPVWKKDGSSSEAMSATRTSEQDATTAWMQVLAESLDFSVENMTRVYNPVSVSTTDCNKNAFASYSDNSVSTTVSGLPFVSCYHGVNDGVLFPAETGLLFFKPPRFLPRGTLHSIDCTGSNRYVTFTVVTDAQEHIEFTNIHKQEQDVLKRYIHGTLIPAMQRDIDGNDVSADSRSNKRDDAEEDEVVESGNRKKRKAAADAAVVNKRALLEDDNEEEDDDDDDEDFAEAANDDDDDEDASSSDDEEDEDGGANGDGKSGDETESEDEDD